MTIESRVTRILSYVTRFARWNASVLVFVSVSGQALLFGQNSGAAPSKAADGTAVLDRSRRARSR